MEFKCYEGQTVNTICRTCLKILNQSDEDGEEPVKPSLYNLSDLPELAEKLVAIYKNEELSLPQNLCDTCFGKVESFYDFYNLCKDSATKFQFLMDNNFIRTEETAVDIVKVETPEKDSESEDDDGDDHHDEAYDPLEAHDDQSDDSDAPIMKQVKLTITRVNQAAQEKSKLQVFACDKCPKRFYKEYRYTAHLRTHEGLKPFVCNHCDKTFSKASGLTSHIRDIHETPGVNYYCTEPDCDKVYQRKQTLQWHMRTCHPKETDEITGERVQRSMIICEDCGKTFKNLTSLKKHRFKHTGEELPFECLECHKRYVTNHKLKEHMMRHAGIKNFICPHCGMRKTTRHELKTHINYHTKEKQYSCKFCEYVGNSSGNLSRHVRIVHEGVKEYACRYCERKFGKAETCKHHEMTHTGEKPHECNMCGKRFIQSIALKTHMKRHEKNMNLKRVELLPQEHQEQMGVEEGPPTVFF